MKKVENAASLPLLTFGCTQGLHYKSQFVPQFSPIIFFFFEVAPKPEPRAT